MKKVSITLLVLLSVLLWGADASAQAKTKDGTVTGSSNFPDPNAVLELESANKGLLMPRVALTALNAASPLSAHTAGMTVYNTATAGSGVNAVSPGYYYNDGTKWVRVNVEPWYNKSTLAQATANTDTIYTMGQVGIGTNDPQRRLHVAGMKDSAAVASSGYNLISPTIRVEGMNATNNKTHLAVDGDNSVKPVFTTSNGDLVTGNFNQVLAGSTDLTADIYPGVTIIASSGESVTDTITARTFVLTKTSLVRILYSVDINSVFHSNESSIQDGHAKMLRNHISFFSVPEGSPVQAGIRTGYSSQIYSSSASGSPVGAFYNTAAVDVVLTPGTYTVGLMGTVFSGTGSVRAIFGQDLGPTSAGPNRFSIIAQPL